MIDPITYFELLAGNMYESFSGLDADGNVVPFLATSWEAHDDNRGFRFHLRARVSFQKRPHLERSGRQVVARATAHSWKPRRVEREICGFYRGGGCGSKR